MTGIENSDFYKNKIHNDGFFIVDNFFQKELCDYLRIHALNSKIIEDTYDDYYAVDYDNQYCANKEIEKLVTNIIPNLLTKFYPFLIENRNIFQRGWYFIHDNYQYKSVRKHKDTDAYITANLWVTPDEYQETISQNYNGFIIHTEQESVTIPYKFNRLTMFFSQLEHESLLSRFKSGHDKKKVNFTFLFGIPL
jgi:hypothetical protein